MNGSVQVAITGSTGAVGGMVARHLAAQGIPSRLLVRSASRSPGLPGADVRECSYADGAASERALAGVSTLLMVSASESADRLDQHRTFVEAAASAGVQHIIYTSFLAAAPDATFTLARDHYATEGFIRATGMAHTFLRDSLYLDFMSDLVGEDGVIRGPAGDGAVAAVARADIARVAAVVLQDPAPHAGQTYDLTGPEALTLAQVAAILSQHRGTPVSFHDETLAEAWASRAVWGAPNWQTEAWVSTYTAIASGELSTVTDSVERLTGRAPLSLRDVLASS